MKRPLRRRAAALLIAGALVASAPSTASAAPTSSSASRSTSGIAVHFQYPEGDPRYSKKNHEIVANMLEDQFDAIRPHGKQKPWNVYIAMYDLRGNAKVKNDVVDRLLNHIARSRAIVHVVFDSHQAPGRTFPYCSSGNYLAKPKSWTGAAARLWCIATVDGKYHSRFHRCTYDCIANGKKGIQHNKFVLFAAPGAHSARVVYAFSANWTVSQLRNYYQTLIVIRHRPALYRSFHDYWVSLAYHHKHAAPDYGGNGPFRIVYYPRAKDPVLAELDRVNCHAGGGVIRLRSNNFNNPHLAARLRQMSRNGCTVRILVNWHGIQHEYGLHKQKLCVPNLHNKDVVITSQFSRKHPDVAVWTGSHPFGPGFTGSADFDIRLPGSFWAQKYATDFDKAYAIAKHDCVDSK